jgi:Carboxypeptidase regulatory-like domain
MTRKAELACQAAALVLGMSITTALPASAADALLSGVVKSPKGEAMGGVTVSAKAEGTTITTTVFTDETGGYYFPPLPSGKYHVWAQALSFATAKGDADLTANRHLDFQLQPLTDREQQVRQLPGDLILAGLPEDTPDDKRLKQIVRNNCTSCHTPSYPLQHRFDEAGWNAIIQTMKQINVYGIYKPGGPVNPVLDFHQKELAAYLARARGPQPGGFKITTRPRPSGEAARAVFTEYDVPLNPDQVLPAPDHPNDGSDWSLGTPSRVGSLPHDAAADFDGNLWFAAVMPNRTMSVGRIDAKTGAIKPFKIEAANGLAAVSHGLIRDDKGMIWFNAHISRGSLAKVDPKTEKVSVYVPPLGMSQIDGPVTLDVDGAGFIWAGTNDGVLRFDPVAEKFTEMKSVTPRTAKGGIGTTDGVAGDRDGNAWWTQMAFDIVAKADVKTGQSSEWTLPPVTEQIKLATPADVKFYDSYAPTDIGTPFPWSQGPRRIGMDRAAGVLWVANSWGGSLTRGSITTTMSGPRCGPPTRSPNTTRRARNGRSSTCRSVAQRCASPRCSSRTAGARS